MLTKKIYKTKDSEIRKVYFYDEEEHQKYAVFAIIAPVDEAIKKGLILLQDNQKYTVDDFNRWVVLIPGEDYNDVEIIEFNTLEEAKTWCRK